MKAVLLFKCKLKRFQKRNENSFVLIIIFLRQK